MNESSVYPILFTPSRREAMDTLEWLGEHETLPRLLISMRASLEYSIGRDVLLDALAREREKEATKDA